MEFKWNRKLSIFVLFMFITVTFASFNTNLFINGKAYVRVDEAIRIVDIHLLDTEYDGYETMEPEFNKNEITMDANLPKQASSVTYQVSIQNTYPYDYDITDIIEESFTNEDVSYEIVGVNKNTILPKNTTTTFTIKFTNNKTIQEEEDVYQTLTYTFDYTGEEQEFVVPYTGTYTLEVWGAQGGNATSEIADNYIGGYGGYSKGKIELQKNQKLSINVGGAGITNTSAVKYVDGGYNGGGPSGYNSQVWIGSSGGGATHISFLSGELRKLEKYKGTLIDNSYYSSDQIIIVASGGGGACAATREEELYGSGNGGSGGGIVGSSGETNGNSYRYPAGAGGTQVKSADFRISCGLSSFGSYVNSRPQCGHGGPGGGFYAGNAGSGAAGGGGSGYIANSSLTEKVMYCYNCQESNEIQTKTISTNNHSKTPISNYAKEGNGYARLSVTTKIDTGDIFDYSYSESEKVFTAPYTGTYKLEVWGAQGGYYNKDYPGGYGGYSTGNISLEKNTNLYINVGGKGSYTSNSPAIDGGYNGGGKARGLTNYNVYSGSGGGASHIATESGLLNTFEEKHDKLLIVAGGGGGSLYYSRYKSSGGSGGGYIGSNASTIDFTQNYYWTGISTGGTQNTGGIGYNSCNTNDCEGEETNGKFGLGGTYNNGESSKIAGGGAGYYGGGGSIRQAGGGGSGYIGNSLLTDKKMYCYECQESNDFNTKTVTTLSHSTQPKENVAKEGNGYSKITLLKRHINNTKLTLKFEFARHLYDYTITYNENHLEPNLLKDYFQTSLINRCCGTFDNPLLETINILTDEKGLYYNSFNVAGDDGPNRGYYIRTRYNFPLEEGKEYKVSFEAYARTTSTCSIGPEQNHNRVHNIIIQGGVWKKYSFSFVAVNETYSQFIIYDWMSKTFENELTIRNIEVSETQSEVTHIKTSTETQPLGNNIASTPFRDGWKFLGWYDDPIEGNKITASTITPSEDTTYYAHWEQVNYDVEYDLDGGTITNPPNNYYYLSDEKNIPSPTKSGYVFAGWTGGKNLINVDELSQTAQNYDIYVDETGLVIDGTNTTDGRVWGYPRSNWFASLDSGTYTLTLYFEEQCTNTGSSALNVYDSNSTVLRSVQNLANKDVATYSFTINEPKDIGIFIKAYDGKYRVQLEKGNARTNYEKYLSTPDVNLTIPYYSSGNRKYTAIWKENYNIEYDLDGGTMTNQPNVYSELTETFTLPTPTKTGYTFAGWTGGKNVFSYDYIDSQQVVGQGGTVGTSGKRGIFDVKPNTYYSLSTNLPKREDNGRYVLISSSDDINSDIISGNNGADANTSRTVISTENGHILISYFKQLLSSEMLTQLNNDEYWFQIEEGDAPTTHELNIETPTPTVTIPKGSTGNRKYIANWIQNE